MIPESIPFVFDPLNVKDFALGAFIALALRRGRIDSVLDQYLPGVKADDGMES